LTWLGCTARECRRNRVRLAERIGHVYFFDS
jgi:hypothetical protein